MAWRLAQSHAAPHTACEGEAETSDPTSLPRWPFEGWSQLGFWRDSCLYAPRESQWIVIYAEPESGQWLTR